jgi:hypothetical protein
MICFGTLGAMGHHRVGGSGVARFATGMENRTRRCGDYLERACRLHGTLGRNDHSLEE